MEMRYAGNIRASDAENKRVEWTSWRSENTGYVPHGLAREQVWVFTLVRPYLSVTEYNMVMTSPSTLMYSMKSSTSSGSSDFYIMS